METTPPYVISLAPVDPDTRGKLLGFMNTHEQQPGDAGLDLLSLKTLVVPARSHSVRIPLGICAMVRRRDMATEGTYVDWSWWLAMRSSTGSRTPLRLSNCIGIIDSGYRGEIIALVDNVSDSDYTLEGGKSYFQMILPDGTPINRDAGVVLLPSLPETPRAADGFGSTD